MNRYDVAVIGAGAAGMMAAITASGRGERVVMIDRNGHLGRKVLATGNGRCNLTNSCVTPDSFHGGDGDLIETILNRFDQPTTMEFFADLGLVLREEADGRIFPRTNQASSVVEVMRQRLERNGVEVLLDSQVTGIEHSTGWRTLLANGGAIESDKLVVAAGGRAANQLGSTGDGLYWATKLGHTLTWMHAALVPVEVVEEWPKKCQGVKVEAGVWTTGGDERVCESLGDVLFTSYGLSGPAVMAQARCIASLLKTNGARVHIDLFPEYSEEQLDRLVLRVFGDGTKTLGEAMVGVLPAGLIAPVVKLAGLGESLLVSSLSPDRRRHLVFLLKDLSLTVSKLRPLKEAQVTAGGLNSSEVDYRTLESKIAPGLFFAGEMLDVDGDSGGFNLQWAWSSGYVAGLTGG